MTAEFWEFMDTVAKVGLGAVTAGIVTYIVTKLQHRHSVEQVTVRRRLELIEEITAGVAEFGNAIARFCLVTENIFDAIYRQNSTIGTPPQEWVDERDSLGIILKRGSALEKPEGLVYLVSADAVLPRALNELQRFADDVMNEAGQEMQDLSSDNLNKTLEKFRLQAAFLMGELGKVYRKPTI